ncbi:hypothetical protein L9F63_001155 [Diploptera punctata]|uniref:Uncharacterized protein n=1 Tax=Diploptera punctata TaxID=6984 RepID=A0AAD8EJI3_DIPPU|nr:hypothetical protein L9F63_001155 [Diploptera punctata]
MWQLPNEGLFSIFDFFINVLTELVTVDPPDEVRLNILRTLTSGYSPEIAARICEVLNDDGTANMHISPLIKPHIKEVKRKLEEALQTAEMVTEDPPDEARLNILSNLTSGHSPEIAARISEVLNDDGTANMHISPLVRPHIKEAQRKFEQALHTVELVTGDPPDEARLNILRTLTSGYSPEIAARICEVLNDDGTAIMHISPLIRPHIKEVKRKLEQALQTAELVTGDPPDEARLNILRTLTAGYSPEIAARICEVLSDDGTANMHISPLIKPHIKEVKRKMEEALQTAELVTGDPPDEARLNILRTLTSGYSPEIAARICEVLNDDGTANMHISPLIKPHIKEVKRKLEEALQTAEMVTEDPPDEARLNILRTLTSGYSLEIAARICEVLNDDGTANMHISPLVRPHIKEVQRKFEQALHTVELVTGDPPDEARLNILRTLTSGYSPEIAAVKF